MGHIDANIDFINGDTGVDRPAPQRAKREPKTHLQHKRAPQCGVRAKKPLYVKPGEDPTCGNCQRSAKR